jgi:hypothetical protein
MDARLGPQLAQKATLPRNVAPSITIQQVTEAVGVPVNFAFETQKGGTSLPLSEGRKRAMLAAFARLYPSRDLKGQKRASFATGRKCSLGCKVEGFHPEEKRPTADGDKGEGRAAGTVTASKLKRHEDALIPLPKLSDLGMTTKEASNWQLLAEAALVQKRCSIKLVRQKPLCGKPVDAPSLRTKTVTFPVAPHCGKVC